MCIQYPSNGEDPGRRDPDRRDDVGRVPRRTVAYVTWIAFYDSLPFPLRYSPRLKAVIYTVGTVLFIVAVVLLFLGGPSGHGWGHR